MKFAVSSNPTIELNVCCDVLVQEGIAAEITVEITGTDADKVKVSQSGNAISIIQQGTSGVNIVTGNGNGNVVIGGNVSGTSISQVNGVTYISGGTAYVGDVYVNGRKVAFEDSDRPEPVEPVKITILCPVDTSIDATLRGVANLIVKTSITDCELYCQGSTSFAINSVEDLRIDASGSAKGKIKHVSGSIDLDLSGSVDVELWGSPKSVKIDASGMGRVLTHGQVKGDYRVNASGMATIAHSGSVDGKIKQHTSGMCRVSI